MGMKKSNIHCRQWRGEQAYFAKIQFSSRFIMFYLKDGQAILSINGIEVTLRQGMGLLLATDQCYQVRRLSEEAYMIGLEVEPSHLFAPELAAHYVDPFLRSNRSHCLLTTSDRAQHSILKTIEKAIRYVGSDGPFSWMDATLQLAVVWRYWIQQPVSSERKHRSSHLQVHAMVTYIEDHLSEKITLTQIATVAKLSRSECCRIFARYSETSPLAYVQGCKMDRAANELRQTDTSVATIAKRYGFNSASHFVQSFKKHHGRTPLAYRKLEST